MSGPEKQFENKVKDYLRKNKCWYIKYWGGGDFTKAGIPDLLVCVNGYFLAIELKSSRGKATELQKVQIDLIRKSGGIAIILYPSMFNEFTNLIQDLKNNSNVYLEQYKFDDTI